MRDDSLSELSTAQLRAAVRAVLLDVLPDAVTQNSPGVAADGTDAVTLHTDAELDAFVQRVAGLCEDPAQRAALRNGHRRFRLSGQESVQGTAQKTAQETAQVNGQGTSAGAGRSAAVTQSSAHRIEHGAVTERAVKKAATDGVRLILGRRAVLTPLARDKARLLGVEIEKER